MEDLLALSASAGAAQCAEGAAHGGVPRQAAERGAGHGRGIQAEALPYGKVKSIRDSVAGDPGLDILLAGCVEPDLKAKELKEKYGGATPAETVKAMLLPGEIEDLSRAVERLCGFRRITIDEVKNA